MPINETGHARNIENFQRLISFVTAFGAIYNPTNPLILPAALNGKLTAANTALDNVSATISPWKLAVNDREIAFAPINKLTTRVVNAYAATGTDVENVADARTFARKIQGTRATPAVKDNPATPEDESAESNSASQMSYTQRVENLENLINLLSDDPKYTPNEIELQTATLTTLANDLKSKNNAVINTSTPLSNSRISRNDALYAKDSGMLTQAALVKKYVKSVFGADSAQFKQVNDLEFKTQKDK